MHQQVRDKDWGRVKVRIAGRVRGEVRVIVAVRVWIQIELRECSCDKLIMHQQVRIDSLLPSELLNFLLFIMKL
jgi:hypothetical protein